MKKTRCPYCGHALADHRKDCGCTEIVRDPHRESIMDQCRCTRYPDRLGRWRR